MIGIIDYGMGNLGSVSNACVFLNLKAQVLESPDRLDECRALILPGQGAFGDCMGNMAAAGFVEPLKQWIADDHPLLGVCVGFQALFEGSEESPGVEGLGVLPGVLKRFVSDELKIPQMGWNRVRQQGSSPMYACVQDEAHFYFVHSYYAEQQGKDWEVGITEYGIEYTSVIQRGRMFATQFHPEKSQACGLQLLRNFSTLFDKELIS